MKKEKSLERLLKNWKVCTGAKRQIRNLTPRVAWRRLIRCEYDTDYFAWFVSALMARLTQDQVRTALKLPKSRYIYKCCPDCFYASVGKLTYPKVIKLLKLKGYNF